MDLRFINYNCAMDPRFKELSAIGFKKVDVSDDYDYYTYYEYKNNGITLLSSGTDEEFKVYFGDKMTYWTDLDIIRNMIYFVNQSEID